jgi:hypothetical protein
MFVTFIVLIAIGGSIERKIIWIYLLKIGEKPSDLHSRSKSFLL